MEFCLVSGGMLFSMLLKRSVNNSQSASDVPNSSTIESKASERVAASQSATHNSASNSQSDNSEDVGQEEDDAPLITSPESDLRNYGTCPQQELSENSTTSTQQMRETCDCKLAFNLGILLSLILIILEAICYDDDIHERLIAYFYGARLVYYSILLIATVIATVLIYNKIPLKDKRFHSETILLIVAATGEFVYLYFGILAATAAFNEEKTHAMFHEQTLQEEKAENPSTLLLISQLNLFSNIIDIFQIGIQTFLLILMEGADVSRLFSSQNFTHRRKHILMEMLWYLCACNFFKWVTDSFIEGHFLTTSESKTLVFGVATWTGITQTTYPLVLFYRFHSVHMILKVIDYDQN